MLRHPTQSAAGISRVRCEARATPACCAAGQVRFRLIQSGFRKRPRDRRHAGGESAWERNYDIAWYAMESVAERKGPAEPARLLDAFQHGGARFDDEVDALLEKRYGVDRAGLARKAGALILRDYH